MIITQPNYSEIKQSIGWYSIYKAQSTTFLTQFEQTTRFDSQPSWVQYRRNRALELQIAKQMQDVDSGDSWSDSCSSKVFGLSRIVNCYGCSRLRNSWNRSRSCSNFDQQKLSSTCKLRINNTFAPRQWILDGIFEEKFWWSFRRNARRANCSVFSVMAFVKECDCRKIVRIMWESWELWERLWKKLRESLCREWFCREKELWELWLEWFC